MGFWRFFWPSDGFGGGASVILCSGGYGGSARFDVDCDCFGWWFDEEYCDGEVLLWRRFETALLVSG
jgi:hypothetical protein